MIILLLFSWNFVIKGCIDGYPRYMQYLVLHTDNLAATMLHDFTGCLPANGILSRIRADGGGEYTHYEAFMRFFYDEDRLIRGKSIHNTRIERLWKMLSRRWEASTLRYSPT
jgi:hypothetical protein